MQTLETLQPTSIAPETVARPLGKTVFELLAQPIDTTHQSQPVRPGTFQPSQRPTFLGNTFMGIDRDTEPD